MKLTNQLYDRIQATEPKEFQQYLLIFLGISFLLCTGISFQLYRTTSALSKRIIEINDEREETVQEILEYSADVKHQQEELNRILSEELDFKIAGYFNKLLEGLGITDKQVSIETPSQVRIDDTYRESILRAKFDTMNMREVTELLQRLEKNKRISTKQLEIVTSSKQPGTLQVQLTIATMLLQTAF